MLIDHITNRMTTILYSYLIKQSKFLMNTNFQSKFLMNTNFQSKFLMNTNF